MYPRLNQGEFLYVGFLSKIDNNLNHKQSINLYYKNQFPNYKIGEQILKIFVINLHSNDTPPSSGLLDRTNVVCLFKCPLGDRVSKESV